MTTLAGFHDRDTVPKPRRIETTLGGQQSREMKFLPFLLVAALLHGCAQIPKAIREPAPQPVTLAEARQAQQPATGTVVRWGGTIAAVDNRENVTYVEIVERPLNDAGRPRDTDRTAGRFLARFNRFLDPAVYREGREITVLGPIADRVTRKIGEFNYSYPVVDAKGHVLWAIERPVYRDPYYYDPFWPSPFWYDPWYPWYHPFHRPYYRW